MKVLLQSEKDKQEFEDMKACYEAIKKARLVRRPVNVRTEGVTHTMIPMSMWEVLQPVIDVVDKEVGCENRPRTDA